MGDTTSVNLRIDKELKAQAETLFASLGMNMTTAINVFLKQAVRDQGLPFKVSAKEEYDTVPAFTGKALEYDSYEKFIADGLKTADLKVADGKMKYYTADEVRAGLEDVLNGKVQR